MRYTASSLHRVAALFLILSLLFPLYSAAASDSLIDSDQLTEDQQIFHVLNRLGFGPRPGDVERVRKIGLKNYIDAQLSPEKLGDTDAESRVKNIPILLLTNSQIFEKYPNPVALNQLVRQSGSRRAAENMRMGNSSVDITEDQAVDDLANREKIMELSNKHGFRRPAEIVRQLNASRIIRAVYSERQLQEVMVDFWSNHFNVYANKQLVRWYLPEYDRDVIRPNALGNFKDLLLATAQSPAMLYYLDNFQSAAPNRSANNNRRLLTERQIENIKNNPQARERIKRNRNWNDQQLEQFIKASQNPEPIQQQRRGINENYAREIMELHTLGVDGGYTQKDIQEVARAFTGWTIADPRGILKTAEIIGIDDDRPALRRSAFPPGIKSGQFFFQSRDHDNAEKIVLGKKINKGGVNDGLEVIDLLAEHPSTARNIAKKLAVKFISDNPGEDSIDEIAAAFTRSKGDIKTTLRAVFETEEFFAPKNYRAKIKTPFEVAISGIRAVGANTNGQGVQQLINKMGEPLYGYQAPTGYPDTAQDWVNTGAMLERINFALALASNSIPGTRTNTTEIKKYAAGSDHLSSLISVILNGEMSVSSREILKKQMNVPLTIPKLDEDDENQMSAAPQARQEQTNIAADVETIKTIGLILGSPEFQRQ